MGDWEPLTRAFYEPSAAIVAPRLLGHWLICNTESGPIGGPIVETEAYLRGDAACHAARGLTPRNAIMFGPAGHAYVYFIYGCHYCMNAVCLPSGAAEAVLIRAIEPAFGLDQMRRARGAQPDLNLTSGPGKLCRALNITRQQNGADLCDAGSPVFIAQNPKRDQFRKSHGGVKISERIGITQAATLPLRFFLESNPHISKGARRFGARMAKGDLPLTRLLCP